MYKTLTDREPNAENSGESWFDPWQTTHTDVDSVPSSQYRDKYYLTFKRTDFLSKMWVFKKEN